MLTVNPNLRMIFQIYTLQLQLFKLLRKVLNHLMNTTPIIHL